jgi:uncharacterized repeat protein (TIGR01451 family)
MLRVSATTCRILSAAFSLTLLMGLTLQVARPAAAAPTPFSGGFSPTIFGSLADLNGDGVGDGTDDSNAFYGDTSIIDGQLDCNAWTTENDGTAGDGTIDTADDCTLIGYDGTPDGVTIGVVDGQFATADGAPIADGTSLPTVFNATTPDDPSVVDADFAWSTIDGRVDSNGDGTIDGNECHFGIIGDANILGSDPGCGFAVTPDPAFDGLVDLNGDGDITAADTCDDGCFFGHDVNDGVVGFPANATAGTVTSTVYSDNACTLSPRDAGTKTVVDGVVPDSDTLTFNSAGTFYWQAVYSGDANNDAATSDCASEALVVSAGGGGGGGGGGAVTADLSVTKTASSPAKVGSSLTYTITVHNAGPSDNSMGVTLTDTLPSGVAFVSATSGKGTCSQATMTVTCNIGTLTVNESVTVTIVVTPSAAGDITNTARVTASTIDEKPTNNTASVTTTVVAGGHKHKRSVSLRLRDALRARGKVSVADGFAACASHVPVKVQMRVSGHWKTIKSVTTSGSGAYKTKLPNKHGTYRSLAPRVKKGATDICARAISPKRTH